MRENELRALLETTTDRIEAPHLAGAALTTARRRRGWRRAGAGAVTVAAVVAAFSLVPDAADRTEPAPDPSAPTPTVSSGPATQPLWDPYDVVDLARRPSGLPPELVPPPEAPLVALAPMDGVVAAWPQEGHDLRLLGTDGVWRAVPLHGEPWSAYSVADVARPAISADGTRVAIPSLDGVRVIDVTTGREQTLPWPQPFKPPRDNPPGLLWQPGDAGLIVFDLDGTYLVGLDGGVREAPYRSYALGVDPEGLVFQNAFRDRTLRTWQGEELVHESPLHQCERLVGGFGLMACTTGSLEPSRSGPIVVDPVTGDVLAYAPIKDRNAVYSDNGHLTTMGFLDEDTVLLLVGPADFSDKDPPPETWHLVAWEFRTGAFELITSGEEQMRSIAVAPHLLDQSRP